MNKVFPQLKLSFFLLTFLLSFGCAPISQSPVLSIETGMHTAAVTSIDVDEKERFFVTASLDKTIRVWSSESGELLNTLRVPVGEDDDGKIYACAISPDSRLIAAGVTGSELSGKSIYIFERTSGQILRRITGMADVINHLSFSGKGNFLVESIGGTGGIRVWETGNWTIRFKDSSYGGSSHWADFDRRGRLVTTSADGMVRLYNSNFELLASIRPPGGKEPFCAVFSPDGQRIAVGFNDTINVNVLSANNLLLLYAPDTSNVLKGRPFVPDSSNTMDGYLGTVCWSADGNTLYSGGIYNDRGIVPINSWADQGRAEYKEIDVGVTNSIADLKPLSNGLLFATFDSSFGMLNGKDELKMIHQPVSIDTRHNHRNFLISKDGSVLQFALGLGGERSVQFSLHNHLLIAVDQITDVTKLTAPRLTSSQFGVSGWEANHTPKRNGEFIPFEKDEVAQSLAIHPGNRGFVLGTSKFVRCYDARAQLRWKKRTSTGWAVNISGNGKIVAATLGDGTVRWYRWQNGDELASLFVTRNGNRWVMWTPDGFFDHSPGGETMIGYQLNQGSGKAPVFVSIDQMYEYYYRPDIIFSRFFGTDLPVERPVVPQPRIDNFISKGMPPEVLVKVSHRETEQESVTVKVKLIDTGGGIGRVLYRVNGATLGEDLLGRAAGLNKRVEVSKSLPLATGENVIQVTAFNKSNEIESKPVQIKVKRKTLEVQKPDLYLLAVGIDQYRDHALKLNYSVNDAKVLVEAIRKHGRGLYRDIHAEYVLDNEATRDNIRNAFVGINKKMQPDDIFVLYMAGHGLTVENNYYFFPWELIYTGDDSVKKDALSRSELQQLLSMVPAQKAVVLLDTCNAGAFSGSSMRGLVAKTAIYKLVRATGRATIMASSDDQAAMEGYRGHGVFTWALIEGIKGAADTLGNKDQATSINEIAEFVVETVPKITMEQWQYEQFPMHNLSGSSFPLGLVQ